MIGPFKRALGRTRRWVQELSAGWLIALCTVLGAGLIVIVVMAHRAYEFIQHDNDFCNTCHLMEQPFAKFNQSAHRQLGCKSCHRPTLIQRSRMALVAVIQNPSKVGEHAPVSNERCGECHVTGNPREWKLISNTAGHRVHLESNDPALKGLQCITCHSTSIHQFNTVARTCAQSGCHEKSQIQLGRMSNLEVHCSVCHDFNRPVAAKAPGDSLKVKLQPERVDCLSCHAMRQRLRDLPANEPHKGVCGTCHNPHDQSTPQAALKTCSSGTCHERVDTVSPFHRGIAQSALANCTSCHNAHDWKVKSTDCRACHSPASLDGPRRRIAPSPHKAGTMSTGAFEMVLLPYRLLFAMLQQIPRTVPKLAEPFSHKRHENLSCTSCHATDLSHGALKVKTPADCQACHHSEQQEKRCASCHPLQQTPLGTVPKPAAPFSHKRHENLSCTSCHATDPSHGMLKVKTPADCQGCHHSERQEERCASCHPLQELAGTRERTFALKLSVWSSARPRRFGFAHELHATVDCRACHQDAPSFAAVPGCEQCHAAHHDVARTCTSCHAKVADPKVHDRRVHVTCSGSGCHDAAALPDPVDARSVCLSCHTQQANHEPGGECAACHLPGAKKGEPMSERPGR